MTDFIPEIDLTPETTEDRMNKMNHEDLLAEIVMLKKKCSELTKKNDSLTDKINSLRNKFGLEICQYFNQCRSIKKTAEYFSYEDIVQCGYDLLNFFDASDPVQRAEDYKEFCKLDGRCYNSEDDNSSENDE